MDKLQYLGRILALLLYNFKYKYKNYIRLRSNELSMKQNYRTNLTGNAVAHFDLSSSTHTHRPRSPYRSYRRQPSFSLQQQRAAACAQQLSLFLGCAHSTHHRRTPTSSSLSISSSASSCSGDSPPQPSVSRKQNQKTSRPCVRECVILVALPLASSIVVYRREVCRLRMSIHFAPVNQNHAVGGSA